MEDLLHLKYGKRSALKNYLSLCKDYRLSILGAVAVFIIKHSPVWVLPIITANIINLLTAGDPDAARGIAMQFAVGAAFIWLNLPTHVAFIRLISTIKRNMEKNLRWALCLRLQQLSIPFHVNNRLGVLQTKVLRDVENIESLTHTLCEGLPNIVLSFIVVIGVTLLRAPQFILFYLLTVPIAVVIYRLARNRMWKYNHDFRESVEDMSGKLAEMLKLIPVTRAHNLEETEMAKIDRKLEQVKDTGMRLDVLTSVFGSLNWVVFMFFNLLTMFAAGMLSYKGIIVIKVGDVVLLASYFSAITSAVMQLLNTVPALAKGLESVRSIGEVLECPDIERNSGKPKLNAIRGEFDFNNVAFHYGDPNLPALENFSLRVRAGEIIAIVGPSGSGKSTLMQLIIGFIRPTSGRIFIDGHNIEDIDLRSYRKFISVVSQETILFDGTIRDNITYGRCNLPEARLREVVESASLAEFVAGLPEGLLTEVKENGARLSGGQRQRLAIARALARDPRVLVLDEATSALDVEAEAQIQSALERLIRGRTTFIVAHRLSTIRCADRIAVLEQGKIAELGTHDELMARGGIYTRMVKLQSGELPPEEIGK